MYHIFSKYKIGIFPLTYLVVAALCVLLAGCDINIGVGGSGGGAPCQSNCTAGSGVHGVRVIVEPNAGDRPISDAIRGAQKSVWLEIYLLTDRNVISALEEAANRGVDVRVMLEPHPVGGGTSPTRTIDQLRAAGIKAQPTDASFALTHEKGMIIDANTAFIMTSNFTRSALGGSSGSSGFRNREYDIIDTNPFASIDQKGVGRLMEITRDLGRKTRPDIKLGICGEHGGEPASVKFCHRLGLDYVSCSPFRIPIARLAAAQAALES